MSGGGGGHVGPLFSEEELRGISDVKHGQGFLEVLCGCTSGFGDFVGRLRIFPNDKLDISCECLPGCQEDKLTPIEFERHSGRETSGKWKNNIWVMRGGKKVSVVKTALIKYYDQAAKRGSRRGPQPKTCHRDEFLPCKVCNKERRFRLRTKEDRHIYHAALVDANWKCSDSKFEKITCESDEERASRKLLRGCIRSPQCKGCTSCVCFGCETCRFPGCSCQNCVDFKQSTN